MINIECIKQTPLNFRDLSKLIVQYRLNENHYKMQRIFGCSFRRNGYEGPDGKINVEKLQTYVETLFKTFKFDPANAKPYANMIAKRCATQLGLNRGQRAIKTINCAATGVARVVASKKTQPRPTKRYINGN